MSAGRMPHCEFLPRQGKQVRPGNHGPANCIKPLQIKKAETPPSERCPGLKCHSVSDKAHINMNPINCKHKLTIDFETYYDKDFSLSKMTTQEYILDKRFEVICVAVKLDDENTKFCWGDKATIQLFLATFPWEDACLIAHNAMFDGAILEWIFNIKPKAYYCTMMGARPNVVPYTGRMSLAKVSEFYKVGEKGTEVVNALGKQRHDFNGIQKLRYIAYCIKDVDLCYDIYKLETQDLPVKEQYVISLTIRKFVRPQLKLNKNLLEQSLEEEQHKRALMLEALAVKFMVDDTEALKKTLMSNPKFAQELRNLGVEPPMKTSPATGKETYAFAKKDLGFQELQEHDDPMVQALVATRLGVKSTQLETRLKTFLNVAKSAAGWFAIPLLYYGAHTGRFSGMDGLNLQNLPRGSDLRAAMEAISGHKIVAGDLSQIEARITALIAQQMDLVQQFANGQDVYSLFAEDLYNKPVSKDTPTERFIGKQCILGLGYGLGHKRFCDDTNSLASVFNIEMEEMTLEESSRIVNFYRAKNRKIVSLWYALNDAIERMAAGDVWRIPGVPIVFMAGRVVLPNGCQIHYPDLKEDFYDAVNDVVYDGWSYNYRGKRKRIYGGALLENIVQALARIVLTDAECALANHNVFAALSVHDELLYVANQEVAHVIEKALHVSLTAVVSWAQALPLEVESAIGETYAECK